MKRLVLCLVVTATFFWPGKDVIAKAPPDFGGDKTVTFGVDKGIVISFGGRSDFAGSGLGVLPRWEQELSSRFAVTANPGLVLRLSALSGLHGTGASGNTTELLLLGGIMRKITPETSVHARTGLNVRTLWNPHEKTAVRGAMLLGGEHRVWRRWVFGTNLFTPNLLFNEAGESVDTGILFTISHAFR
jgi:hypothetical protein